MCWGCGCSQIRLLGDRVRTELAGRLWSKTMGWEVHSNLVTIHQGCKGLMSECCRVLRVRPVAAVLMLDGVWRLLVVRRQGSSFLCGDKAMERKPAVAEPAVLPAATQGTASGCAPTALLLAAAACRRGETTSY